MDAYIARTYTNKIPNGNLVQARKYLATVSYNSNQHMSSLKGYMAEAMFLDKNPEWNYISKVNASQHDVYALNPNGKAGTQTGQIKFHLNGDAATYARDMIADNLSGNFFVPDDHIDNLKVFLKKEADKLYSAGNTNDAKARYRDVNRVKGIGSTAAEIDKATKEALLEAKTNCATSYVLIGMITAATIAPIIWDWHQGTITDQEAKMYLVRSVSTICAGVAVDQFLKYIHGGLFHNTTYGNILVVCAYLIADTARETYHYGSLNKALQSPDFIISLGGKVSGISLGFVSAKWGAQAGGSLAIMVGQCGPQVGFPEEVITVPVFSALGGLAGGTIGMIVGYKSGTYATIRLMKEFFPEKLYVYESEYIQNMRSEIDKTIQSLQAQ